MGKTKALLVAVSEYPLTNQESLPLCKNDLYELKKALVEGLCIPSDNILLCGESGIVNFYDLIKSISDVLKDMTNEDTLIFYFSGHGSQHNGKNCLILSDSFFEMQIIVNYIEKTDIKTKIAIFDSCYSGDFTHNKVPAMNIDTTVDYFAGYGYAVMASCSSNQTSGFDEDRKMSLYTRFLCDSLNAKYLVSKGKKSLESINESIIHLSKIYNQKTGNEEQTPIFRSSIGGTVFFDVEEYNPYKIAEIYEETHNYIIYKVEPIHNGLSKRFVIKTILRYQFTLEEIAEIEKEIVSKAIHYEVFKNELSENTHIGNKANAVCCYFGFDENDIVNGNYKYITTWIDGTVNNNFGFRNNRYTEKINDTYIYTNPSYDLIKSFEDDTIDRDDLIKITKFYTANIISLSEQIIKYFREYVNETISENNLIDSVENLVKQLKRYYIKQSDLDIPPAELKDWSDAHTRLANAAVDISLYYEKNNNWDSKNRKILMRIAISNYQKALEKLKSIDNTV